ncbi:hypothetical protein D9M69_471920 [compost metagenome]
MLRSAADGVTPLNDNSTGSRMRLVKISTATPILAEAARLRITGMSMMANTAKPTASARIAVSPARKRRLKV